MAGNDVPGLENAPKFSTNVPGVQFPFRQEFGKVGRATEEVGQSVEGAALTGKEIYNEVSRQHDISAASNAATQDEVKHSQMVTQLQLSSPDGYVRDQTTGDLVQNSDGSSKTIAQQYWENADSDYQGRQDKMTPQAASMYRQQMQRTIGANTQKLQMEGMRLQAQNTEQNLQNMKDTSSKDFQISPVPNTNAYYTGDGDNGETKQYPNAQKFFDAVQQAQLTRQQMGPVQGRPGMYGLTEVKALQKSDSAELANNWMTSLKDDMLSSAGSRAQLHQNMKDASSTAMMQAHAALDILDGKDPQSKQRGGLPTINSSLSPQEIDKWKTTFLGLIPAAKEVDKSEYQLQRQQLEDYAKGVKNLDQFTGSALFQKTVMAGNGLDMTPAERTKDLTSAFSNAIMASAIAQTSGINSAAAKQQAVNKVLQEGSLKWPQLAQMLGESHTEGFGQAITASASKEVANKLQEDERQMQADPAKYAAGIQEGPQGPGGTPKYRDSMAHMVEHKLDPTTDPSLFSIFRPMSVNGKSPIENAQQTMNNNYSRMFGSRADVAILSNQQFKDQASRIQGSNDPSMISSYFKQLGQSKLTQDQQETYIQHLVEKGGLPQTYVDALNLHTSAEREARWATLQAGPPQMPKDYDEKKISDFVKEDNKGIHTVLNLRYGPNSPGARTAIDTYDKASGDDIKGAINRGMSDDDARAYAQGQRDKTTGAIGIVGAQHDFFGTGFIHWAKGIQVPVEYGSNNYTPDQQQTINASLLHAQSLDTLKGFKFVTPPGSLPKNENAPSDAERIASTASFWRRVGGGWRLQTQELDKENRPTGISQDVRVVGHDGLPHAYQINDSDALRGPPATASKPITPAKALPMGPKW